MILRAVVGIALTVVILAFAGKRLWFLISLARAGKPAVGRTSDAPKRVEAEATEVLGQRKLLKWTIPGLAHVFAFWGFLVLGLTILEAYGALFWSDFGVPVIGTWPVVGFLEDLFGVLVLVGIAIFAVIRLTNNPAKDGRQSRFFGSHTRGAWLILFMIFLVVFTLFWYRGAQSALGNLPFESGAFFSDWVGSLMSGLSETTLEWIETTGIWAQIAVIVCFLLIVLHSKHLHIGAAPVNVYTSRRPNALGPLLPIYYDGAPVNFEDPPDDATFGKGHIAEFTWKNYVDFMACTECGRCQSQCPAWNTGKPLSPKLMMMNLRDTMFAQAPYLMAAGGKHPGLGELHEEALASVGAEVKEQVERPFIGPRAGSDHSADDGYTFDGHRTTGPELPIIDEDALWACTTCGACVNQCPVDIEHIDHFVDMRRNQVMIATEFPSELNGLFKNLETKGNPWGMNTSGRTDWITEVDFDVRVFGMDGEEILSTFYDKITYRRTGDHWRIPFDVERFKGLKAVNDLVDADTGYGNALNVERTVRLLERAGASAIQLEDQDFPKRCGHLDDKTLIPAMEMAGKIKAAVDARQSRDTLIIARTDAVAVEGFDSAVERVAIYREAGADMLFIEAPRERGELARVVESVGKGLPLMANMVEGGKTPIVPAHELEKIGFSFVIFPGGIVRAIARAAQDFYATLHAQGTTDAFRDRMFDFNALNDLIGTPETLERGKWYADYKPGKN